MTGRRPDRRSRQWPKMQPEPNKGLASGRGLAALLGTANEEAADSAAAREGCRSSFCGQIRATRENGSTTWSSTSLRRRSRSAASSSRSSSARFPAWPTPMRSSPASAAGGPPSGPACHDIPAVVVEAGDREALEIAIVENVQRADLNALEEAQGYAQLGADYGYSHGDIARVVGKSRSHVANTLGSTNLPEHTRALLAGGQISAGHARALLAVADPDAMADRIVAQGLTVRDIERLVRMPARPAGRERPPCPSTPTRSRSRASSALRSAQK